jgi:hypothetical protein
MTPQFTPLVVFVDVDDTFVRSFGTKRMPIPSVVQHIKELHEQGAELYCWSSGGAKYARSSAEEFGVENCFIAFLPKPHVLIDDQHPTNWRNFMDVHPLAILKDGVSQYQIALKKQNL